MPLIRALAEAVLLAHFHTQDSPDLPAREPAKRLEAWVWGPAPPRPTEPSSFCPDEPSERQLSGGQTDVLDRKVTPGLLWQGSVAHGHCLGLTHPTSSRSIPCQRDAANASAQRPRTPAFLPGLGGACYPYLLPLHFFLL